VAITRFRLITSLILFDIATQRKRVGALETTFTVPSYERHVPFAKLLIVRFSCGAPRNLSRRKGATRGPETNAARIAFEVKLRRKPRHTVLFHSGETANPPFDYEYVSRHKLCKTHLVARRTGNGGVSR